MRGSAGGLEKLSAGVSGLVKKTLDCTVLGQSGQRLFGGVAGAWFVPTLNNEAADQP